jgi:hypothetical protein
MRNWINLFEYTIPTGDRNKIIRKMVTTLLSNQYWDDNTGGREMGSDLESMIDAWNSDEGTSHEADSPLIKRKVTAWAKERYDWAIEKLSQVPLEDGLYSVKRTIQVPQTWQPADGLGVYWSFDIDYDGVDSPWATDEMRNTGRQVLLHGMVRPDHVDWTNTILANMDWYSGDREQEIRVLKGSPVHLIAFDENTVNQTFEA